MILLLMLACEPKQSTFPTPEFPDPVEEVEYIANNVFDVSFVHEIRVEIDQVGLSNLASDPYSYVKATFSFDGEEMENEVGVRIKGRHGSYRHISTKPALKVDFNKYSDQSFFGLKKLNINNLVQDKAMMHDWTAYKIYNSMGIPAPRVSWTQLYINDDFRGLYVIVEAYDDVFLSQRYKNPEGNLYDGDYVIEGGVSYLVDFKENVHDYFELDEGTDIGRTDIYDVTDAANEGELNGNFYDTMAEFVDMEEFLLFWATEAWVGQCDGYSYNENNYRVYFDPDNYLADFFPWDHDWAFYEQTNIAAPKGRLVYSCMVEESCRSKMDEALTTVNNKIGSLSIIDEVEELDDITWEYVLSDPKKEYSAETVKTTREALKVWLVTRSISL